MKPLLETPSLCAYCRAPSKGFLYKDGDKIFGACSPEHLKKIVSGERLKNIAQLNEQGLAYAIQEAKATYISNAQEQKTFVVHEWEKSYRENLFRTAIRAYLNWANHQAETGKSIYDQSE